MDITVEDLCELEPLLALDDATALAGQRGGAGDIPVSWAVSARATAPHLPTLRGGEILLLPQRVVLAVGADAPILIQEAKNRNVSALVVGSGTDLGIELESRPVVLRSPDDISPELETTINRRLTEARGELYRIGSELERQLAELTMNRVGIVPLVSSVFVATGLPIAVLDARHRVIAIAGESAAQSQPGTDDRPVLQHRLVHGETLVIGPLDTGQRLYGRFFKDRIASAAEVALQRDQETRPRGSKRTEAICALLAGQSRVPSEHRAAALALGLDPDAVYLVAIGQGTTDADLTRTLSGLGETHLASRADGRHAMLVAISVRGRTGNVADRVAEVKRHWEREHTDDKATLALSAPAFGVSSLPAAAREATFIAALQQQAGLSRKAASFESIGDVGAMRLLYELRDSSELKDFVTETLGKLEQRDQRGTLRATLRAFLESGGSQVEASHRLGIHRNTLAYRLRRIGELVGHDVGDPSTWLTLHLALRGAQALQAWSSDI